LLDKVFPPLWIAPFSQCSQYGVEGSIGGIPDVFATPSAVICPSKTALTGHLSAAAYLGRNILMCQTDAGNASPV
jgi:hypothetical protein